MSSSIKTENLGLNFWLADDKPTRSDFVNDNSIIDRTLGEHIANNGIHMNSDDVLRVRSPYYIKLLQGTDEASRIVELDFEPQLVVCFIADEPPTTVNSGTVTVNSGIAVNGYSASGGLALSGDKLRIKQGTVDGVMYNLNNSECQYTVICFR